MTERFSVKGCASFALLLTLLLSSCEILLPSGPKAYGPDDYALGEARPYPQGVRLAKLRLRNFLRRANPQQRLALDQNLYVAIKPNEITAGDARPLLSGVSTAQVRTYDV